MIQKITIQFEGNGNHRTTVNSSECSVNGSEDVRVCRCVCYVYVGANCD